MVASPIGHGVNNEHFFQEPLTSWHKENWRNNGSCNSGIEFLRDSQGKKFVLKYHDSYQLALNEVLGGLIGSSIDNLVNRVTIAPSHYVKKGYCATLHTYAPGKEVGALEETSMIDIKGGLSNKINLESVAMHNDLAKIVAINLFINDWDCHSYNLFFSKADNRFCAIDKGLIFHHSCYLATHAYNFLMRLHKLGWFHSNLTWQEIKSLGITKKTLHILMQTYPPEKIYTEWEKLVENNNFSFAQDQKERFLDGLNKNYQEIEKVYKELEYLTQKKFLAKAMLNTAIDKIAHVGSAAIDYIDGFSHA